MAFWNRKAPFDYTRDDVAETRAAPASGVATPREWLFEALTGGPTPSGQRVTIHRALGLAPVWAAVSMISEQVGQLPLKVYRRYDDPEGEAERVEARQHRMWPILHDRPNAHTPADRFWAAVTAQLLLWGNAFIEKRRSDGITVDELYLLDPHRMTVAYDPDLAIKTFLYEPWNRPRRVYDETEVLHIFGFSIDGLTGLSVIQSQRGGLGIALARDEFEGEFYRHGATLSGVLKHPGKLSPQAAKNLKDSFTELYGGSGRAHGVPVLEEDMDFVQVGSPLKDLEFVAAQQMTRTDVAVMFKLPPNYLGGSSGDSLTYSTVESNQTHFALHTIVPWTNTIAKALTTDPAILPQNVFECEFHLEAMMRGDARDRAAFYDAMVGMRAMLPDEVRQREGLPALTDAQKAEMAANGAPQPVVPTTKANVDMAAAAEQVAAGDQPVNGRVNGIVPPALISRN